MGYLRKGGGTRIKRYEGNFRGNFHEQEHYCEERNKRLFNQSGPHSIAGRRGGRLWKSASPLSFHRSSSRECHQEHRRVINQNPTSGSVRPSNVLLFRITERDKSQIILDDLQSRVAEIVTLESRMGNRLGTTIRYLQATTHGDE